MLNGDLFGFDDSPADVLDDCTAPHSKTDVPAVPDVPASNDAGFHGTAHGTADVPAVPAMGALLARAAETDDGERQQAAIPAVPDNERPCFRVYDGGALLDTGRKLRPGVWHHGMTAPRGGDPAPVDTWVCGPLHIEAQTFDGTGNNFGRLLRFKNTAACSLKCPKNLWTGPGESYVALRREGAAVTVVAEVIVTVQAPVPLQPPPLPFPCAHAPCAPAPPPPPSPSPPSHPPLPSRHSSHEAVGSA